jgi:fructose-1,6-bisphosphatase/inositol monophosphatase family enzyme
MSYQKALKVAVDAAKEAGEVLRREFHRPEGPRGHSSHADADEVAEWLIRKRLLAEFPDFSYRGEETGTATGSDPHIWVVDPNDGTSAYLRRVPGSAVSIALILNGSPVLGVIYSFVFPDDDGDLISWADGEDLRRNNTTIQDSWKDMNQEDAIVLVSLHRQSLSDAIVEILRPYRYRAIPSIAYRLALAAAGDAAAAVSWHSPGDWDYAGGHALLRAAGGIFVNENGMEITYGFDASSKVRRCFGGYSPVVRDLWNRDWDRLRTPKA